MNNEAQRAANRRYKRSAKGRRARQLSEMYSTRDQRGIERTQSQLNNARRARASRAEFLRSKKDGSPCADCGGTLPSYCMDFDHRDPASKTYEVSKMLTCSFALIEIEIAKCDLVCANCHRVRTFTRKHHLLAKDAANDTAQLSLSINDDSTHDDKEAV